MFSCGLFNYFEIIEIFKLKLINFFICHLSGIFKFKQESISDQLEKKEDEKDKEKEEDTNKEKESKSEPLPDNEELKKVFLNYQLLSFC